MKVYFLRLFCLIGALACCVAQINNRTFYTNKSRSAFQHAIDDVLKPYEEFLIGARTKLSEIFDDAASQGVERVAFGSKLSEFGFILLGFMGAATRFNAFVAQLEAMDGAQFGAQFVAHNRHMLASFDHSKDKIVCTFKDLMKSGKCSRNGRSFDVPEFKIGHRPRPFEFRTREKLSIEESERNIYRNLHVTGADVPPGSFPESAMRHYLYDHLYSSQVFHFRVFFDGVEQIKYSVPGQGEHISKVLHCELTYSQLYHELVNKGFVVTSSSKGDRVNQYNPFHLATNATVFSGFPADFQQGYPVRAWSSWAGVLMPQGIEVLLWDPVKNDFLIDVKTMGPWKLAAHQTQQQSVAQSSGSDWMSYLLSMF